MNAMQYIFPENFLLLPRSCKKRKDFIQVWHQWPWFVWLNTQKLKSM